MHSLFHSSHRPQGDRTKEDLVGFATGKKVEKPKEESFFDDTGGWGLLWRGGWGERPDAGSKSAMRQHEQQGVPV